MKRLLSLLLALALVCTLLPMSVLALDENETERDEDEGAPDNSIACQINGHSYVGTLREASCEWYGCMEYTCSVCGDYYENKDENYREPLGHEFPEENRVLQDMPTCTQDGFYAFHCIRYCGIVWWEEAEGTALGHDYVNGTCTRCGRQHTVSGTCGDHATWKLEDRVLTVSGTGPVVTDYDAEYQTYYPAWFDYSEEIVSVVIEDGITSIGEHAFNCCNNLTEVSIPDSVTVIERQAFSFTGLTSVTIPESVTKLGDFAFYYCANLTEVTVPGSIQSMGVNAFGSCKQLERVTIADGVTEIGPHAFSMDYSLTEIVIPASVTAIHGCAFFLCNGLTSIRFEGDAPVFGYDVDGRQEHFAEVTASAYYPANNPTWTADVMQNYDGHITWVPYEEALIPGDVDGDGVLNDGDVAQLLWHTLFPEAYPISGDADFNGDGKVDDLDVAYLLWHTLFPAQYPLK